MSFSIAIIGASTTVGREILQILAERSFPVRNILAVAEPGTNVGGEVSFGEDEELKVIPFDRVDFVGRDLVFNASGADVARDAVTKALTSGGLVLDLSPVFRGEPDVPLVLAGVNPEALADAKRRLVALPGANAALLAHVLKPLHGKAKITRIACATYQAASSGGTAAMDELFRQTRSVYVNDPIEKEFFPKQIAFNVIPQVDAFMDSGATAEEWRLMTETKRLIDSKVKVVATCVYVPVFIGNALAVNIEFASEIDVADARKALKQNNLLAIVDHRVEDGYVTPAESAGEDKVYVSRIRDDITVENGLSLWIAGDNIRTALAMNAVLVAELWQASQQSKKAARH